MFLVIFLSTIYILGSFLGNPRYLLSPPSFCICKQSLISVLMDNGALREKVMEDLLVLIDWPEAVSYLVKICLRVEALVLSALMRNIVSSAKRR